MRDEQMNVDAWGGKRATRGSEPKEPWKNAARQLVAVSRDDSREKHASPRESGFVPHAAVRGKADSMDGSGAADATRDARTTRSSDAWSEAAIRFEYQGGPTHNFCLATRVHGSRGLRVAQSDAVACVVQFSCITDSRYSLRLDGCR